MKQHMDVTHMEYLPYHYLLATVGNAGYLKYHDVSTGLLLTQIPSHLGSPTTMAQNTHSAIIHLGHANGTMTLWSPNLHTPHVKLLAHKGPVTGIAVDPSERSAGRYVATCGMEGTVKLWDGRMWGKEVRHWNVRNSPTTLTYSQRGMLAIGGKSGVTVYRDLISSSDTSFSYSAKSKSNSVSLSTSPPAPQPYLNLPLPALSANDARFCPYDDILAIGHSRGISSLLVPGSGEPNFDSAEADVYESHTRRREREVRGVLEKIRPELITMDTDFLGRVNEGATRPDTFEEREARSYRQLGRMERLKANGQLGHGLGGEVKDDGDEDEDAYDDGQEEGEEGEGGDERKEKAKKRMRGKGTATKRYIRKKKANVVDSSLLAMRAKVAEQRRQEEQKEKRKEKGQQGGALARFG
jgi:U3 small nucleolar RNA-associated protein 7